MGKFQFWQKPAETNKIKGSENRRVTWLELYFDIFFVCAIAAAGHVLVADLSLEGIKDFVMVFIPIWWIWIGFTFYNERFETFGIETRLFTFLMMIPVAGLAVFAHHATGENFTAFTLSYALARSILGFLYGRAAFHIKEFRLTGYVYAVCFAISVIVIVLNALYVPAPIRTVVFGSALAFDLLVPFIATSLDGTFRNPEPLDLSNKINERFGLFSIIVIGELIVAIVNGISTMEHPGANDLILGIAGLAVALGMWWIYFDFIGRRGADKQAMKAYAWAYLHMPLVMSFVGLSAGILYSIEHPGQLESQARLLIGCASGATLIFIGLIEWVSHRHPQEPTHHFLSSGIKFVSGIVLIAMGWYSHFEIVPMVTFIFVAQAISMSYGLWAWFNVPDDSEYNTDYAG